MAFKSARRAALTAAQETKVRQEVNQSLLLVYVYVPLAGVITHVFSPPIFPTSLSKLLRAAWKPWKQKGAL